MSVVQHEKSPYPPIERKDVPEKYHPEKLPCRAGCLYASAEQWKEGEWSWVNYVCAPREWQQRYSSWSSARKCDLGDCPWTAANEGHDPGSTHDRMIRFTKSHVATHTPGKSPFDNYEPARRTDYVIADFFE